MASPGPDKLYLVVDYDNHADPEYHLYSDRDEAITRGRECITYYKESRYPDMESYVNATPESQNGNWILSENGEERWHVCVLEVPVTYKVPCARVEKQPQTNSESR